MNLNNRQEIDPQEYVLSMLPKKMAELVKKQLDKSVKEPVLNALLPELKKAGMGIPSIASAHDFNSFARAYLKHCGASVRGGKQSPPPELTAEQKQEIQRVRSSLIPKKNGMMRKKTAMDVAKELSLPYKVVNDFMNPKGDFLKRK